MQTSPSPAARPGRARRTLNFIYLIIFIVVQFLIIALAFMAGYVWQNWLYGSPEQPNTIAGSLPQMISGKSDYPVLAQAAKLLKDNAYFPLPDDKQLEYGMIRGMLTEYNEPFSVFVEPPQHQLQTQELAGHYGGIGVRIQRDSSGLVYLYPLPNSPALKAGLKDGDRLLEVEGKAITAETGADVLETSLRGEVGKKVNIKVGRAPDYKPLDFSVERAEVPLPSTTWNLAVQNSTVGIIQVRVIADPTSAEITKAVEDLKKQGATRFILDLRGNGGGLVDSGVKIAGLFLKDGEVMEQQYKGQEVKKFMVETPGALADLPMVVLVDRGTASATEILAGAIKAHQRAPIVGTRTFGKDTIQLIFGLLDGSSLHVTAAHWWIPGLDPKIGQNGVQPDVVVPDGASESQFLDAAVKAALDLK